MCAMKGVVVADRFVFFHGGYLSQWYRSPFTAQLADGEPEHEFGCAEQFMMAGKAHLFGDNETLALILADVSPKSQKALGRRVRGFDEATWNAHRSDIVYRGNLAKFTQNRDLAALLVSTAALTIVEASPRDRVWGIGCSERDPRSRDPEQWLGLNLLGRVLMRVRAKLFEEARTAPAPTE